MERMKCKDLRFMTVNQVGVSLREDTQVYMLLVSLKVESKALTEDLAEMCDFSELFRKNIYNLPSKSEVKLSIDLISDTRLISMTLCRM